MGVAQRLRETAGLARRRVYRGRIAVNLSGQQVERSDIIATLRQILEHTALPRVICMASPCLRRGLRPCSGACAEPRVRRPYSGPRPLTLRS
jgi:hypothetical protein